MMNVFQTKPWLWIVIAFAILIVAWTVLISIAVRNQPEKVPLDLGGAADPAARAGE